MTRSDVLRCERCAERLDRETAEWLELNTHTGTFYRPGDVLPSESQGLFAFGARCAVKVLAGAGVLRRIGRAKR